MILADPRNPVALQHRDTLLARLSDQDLDGLIVVLGGDGFMLQSVADNGFERTYLGLNAGRIGFLMNDVDDWDRVAGWLKTRQFVSYDFPVLCADLTLADGTHRRVHAVNDVVLERGTGQTAHLSLSIDGSEVVDLLVADGIVFATALGSTAYTFSAGGPAAHPTLRLMAVTAICPHRPRLQPFLLPPEATAHVGVLASHRRPVRVVADGQTLQDVTAADVCIAKESVTLAWLPGHDLTARMITKIVRP